MDAPKAAVKKVAVTEHFPQKPVALGADDREAITQAIRDAVASYPLARSFAAVLERIVQWYLASRDDARADYLAQRDDDRVRLSEGRRLARTLARLRGRLDAATDLDFSIGRLPNGVPNHDQVRLGELADRVAAGCDVQVRRLLRAVRKPRGHDRALLGGALVQAFRARDLPVTLSRDSLICTMLELAYVAAGEKQPEDMLREIKAAKRQAKLFPVDLKIVEQFGRRRLYRGCERQGARHIARSLRRVRTRSGAARRA